MLDLPVGQPVSAMAHRGLLGTELAMSWDEVSGDSRWHGTVLGLLTTSNSWKKLFVLNDWRGD
jgi:hypothetical protein